MKPRQPLKRAGANFGRQHVWEMRADYGFMSPLMFERRFCCEDVTAWAKSALEDSENVGDRIK